MIYCNFPSIDQPIQLENKSTTFLAIEDKELFGKFVFSLYQQENKETSEFQVLFFDEKFSAISDICFIQNPLLFDFKELRWQKELAQLVESSFETDEKDGIDALFQKILALIDKKLLEDFDLEFSLSEEVGLKELLKFLKLQLVDDSTNIIEKTLFLLSTFAELSFQSLLVFCGLSNLLSAQQMNVVVETAKFNNLSVLFVEHRKDDYWKGGKLFYLDEDYVLWEEEL